MLIFFVAVSYPHYSCCVLTKAYIKLTVIQGSSSKKLAKEGSVTDNDVDANKVSHSTPTHDNVANPSKGEGTAETGKLKKPVDPTRAQV